MKKLIFAAFAAGAMVLAGCTKVEVKDVPENRAIQFSNYVSNPVKSIDGKENLEKFIVYGNTDDNDVIFNGVEVTWDNASSTASYSPIRYWTNNTYRFAAYSDENAAIEQGTVTFNYNASGTTAYLGISDYVVEDGSKDLIYATTGQQEYTYNGSDATMPSVELEFKHILSQIEFNFTKDETLDGHDITISDIKVNAVSTGSYNAASLDNTWTPAMDKMDYTFTPDNAVISGNVADANVTTSKASLILLPQSVTGYKVTFTLTWKKFNADGTEAEEQVTDKFEVSIAGAENGEWAPGKHYIYSATINASNLGEIPIVFTVTDDFNWENGTVTTPGDIVTIE